MHPQILQLLNYSQEDGEEPANKSGKNRKLKENQKNMVLVGVENGHLFQIILKVKFEKDKELTTVLT